MSDQGNTLPPDAPAPAPESAPTVLNDAPAGIQDAIDRVVAESAAVDAEVDAAVFVDAEPAPPEGHVRVEFLHDVSVWVDSVERRFMAGWNVLHENVLATIKQTHQKSAIRE